MTAPILTRLAAYILDATVFLVLGTLGCLFFMGILLALGKSPIVASQLNGNTGATLTLLFLVLWLIIYYVWLPVGNGQTPGKKFFHSRIETINGASYNFIISFFRFVFTWLSGFFFCLGFVVALFNEKRRTLADFVAGTHVNLVGPRKRGFEYLVVFGGFGLYLILILASIAIPTFTRMSEKAQQARQRQEQEQQKQIQPYEPQPGESAPTEGK